MRHPLLVFGLLLLSATAAPAQVSIGLNSPGVSIGIQLSAYPALVRVPNYPVYYAPELDANFFYYDGQYWVYEDDGWYVSSWYNGPWAWVEPTLVPLFVLRVPVRYYRAAPRYFRPWRPEAPPRWGEHWGPQWQQQRRGWDHWDRRAVPAPAPLPSYQRQYSGDRYPRADEQRALQERAGHPTPSQHAVPRPAPVTAPHREERPAPAQPPVQPVRPQPAPPKVEPSTPAPQALPRSPQQQPQPQPQRQQQPQPHSQPPQPQPHPTPPPMHPPAANREPNHPREQPAEPNRPQVSPARPAAPERERERARSEGERGGMDRNR